MTTEIETQRLNEIWRLRAINAELMEALKDLIAAVKQADNWEDEGLAAHAQEMKHAETILAKAEAL